MAYQRSPSVLLPRICLCVIAPLLPLPAVRAQDTETRTLKPAVLAPNETVVLDGHFDEPAWARAGVADDFRQAEPYSGKPAVEQSRVRVVVSHDTLYVAAEALDSQPDKIVAFVRARDGNLIGDDIFAVTIDGFGDGRRAYLFRTNPAGAQRDALIAAEQIPNYNWDGLWDVRTRRTEHGWNAEFAIPTRTLAFDPKATSWRINFHRIQRRLVEESIWSGWKRGEGVFRPQFSGKLEQLPELHQGRGLEFRPYVVGTWSDRPDSGERNKWKPDAGFDVSWQIRPNLKGTLTYNTDFADTEVDERQVNLTRFGLAFPEKRAFFLDGSSVFQFGPTGDWVTPYYSRSIGINPLNGDRVPVLGGVRIAGEAGGWAVGALQLRTRSEGGRDAEDFTVARLSRNVGAESQVGALFTRRAGEGEERITAGVDAQLTRRLGEGNRTTLQPFFLWTNPQDSSTERSLIDASAFGFRAETYTDPWFGFLTVHQAGASYDPALGFRFDPDPFREYFAYGERVWRAPEGSWYRAWTVGTEASYRTDLDNNERDYQLQLFPVILDFPSGDRVESAIATYRDIVPNFRLFGRLPVDAGSYDTHDARFKITTSLSRPIATEVRVQYRSYFDGSLLGYRGELILNPAPGLTLRARANFNDVSLDSGDFRYRVYLLRADYNFTTRHLASAIVQYDNLSRLAGMQLRFRWIVKPGTEVYLGYLLNARDEEDDDWTTLRQESALKLSTVLRW